MPDLDGAETEFEGPCGRAVYVPLPDVPAAEETVCSWLVTAPAFHPLWSQYFLAVVRLRDLEGWPPPERQFQGATHELFCVTLNPEGGPYTPENLLRFMDGPEAGRMPILTPVNVAHQIEGTDEEARLLAMYAAWGITVGALEPESSNGATRIRAGWKGSLVKTLAHIRGEVHAS